MKDILELKEKLQNHQDWIRMLEVMNLAIKLLIL